MTYSTDMSPTEPEKVHKQGNMQCSTFEVNEQTNMQSLMNQFNKINVRKVPENAENFDFSLARKDDLKMRAKVQNKLDLTFDLPTDISMIQRAGDDFQMLYLPETTFDEEEDEQVPGAELMIELTQMINELRKNQKKAIKNKGE